MKKSVFFMFSAAFLAFLYVMIPFSSASIVLPPFNEGYNLGDELSAKTSIQEGSAFEGYFKLYLECDNYTNNFFSLPITLKSDAQKSIDVPPITLTKTGRCSVHALVENQNSEKVEEQTGSIFIISDFIDVSITSNKDTYKPGEKMIIEGTAVGYNKKEIDGEALISIDNSYHVKISRGKFSFNEELYKKTKSGNQTIEVMVDDGKGNFGEMKKKITVLAIPTSIEIFLNKTVFDPGEKIEARAALLDQAGDAIESEIIVTLYDSWGAEIKRESTDGAFEYVGEKDDTPGNWWIYAYSNNLKTRKFIEINEVKSIDIKIDGSILNVTNTGNVGYNGPLSLKFNGEGEQESKTLNINLGVGKSQIFTLSGNCNYSVKADSNVFNRELSAVLTGGSIGVDKNENPWRSIAAIAFIVLIIVAAGILEFRRERNIKIKEITVNASKI